MLFFGPSGNAAKSNVGIIVLVYVLVAIVKKRLNLDVTLYTSLQIVSSTLFEKMRWQQAFAGGEHKAEQGYGCNPPNLFAV